jgi:hypothetical protein
MRAVKEERAEEREKRRHMQIKLGLGAGLAVVGAILLGETAALALVALGLAPWLGHAIIAVVALVCGVLLLKSMPGASEIDTIPESAIKRIGEDVKELATEVKNDIRHATHSDTPLLTDTPHGVRR